MGVKPIKDKQALTADGEKALPTAAANNVKNLSVGSTGADVVKLQQALGIDADGIFGPQTQQAVINYQKANGLDPDGIAGELTLGKLYGTTANNTVPPVAQPPVANPPTAKPPAAQLEPEAPAPSSPEAQPEPEAPSKTVTSPAGFTYGDFQYDPFDPMSDPLVKQAWDVLQQGQANRPGDLVDPYKDKYMGYLDQFESRDPFSYDFNSDALYNQYKDQYIQQGRMAMMDTMGQAAALTGGYGNSYAQTAGQQAYNQQLGQLNEIMPQLYGMAYDRYNQEGQEMLAMHDLYKSLSDQSYAQYQDSMENWYREMDRLQGNYDTLFDQAWNEYILGYNSARSEYDTDRSEAFSKWQMENAKAENTIKEPTAEYRKLEVGSAAYNSMKTDIKRASSIDELKALVKEWVSLGYDPEQLEAMTKEKYKELMPKTDPTQPKKTTTTTGGGRIGLGTVYNTNI